MTEIEALIAKLAVCAIAFALTSYIFPSGSLGFIRAGKGSDGRWHIWWERGQ